MKIDRLKQILESNISIENLKQPKPKHDTDFVREFNFTIRSMDYKIMWWTNIMYLHIGEALIPFNHITINGNWPDGFKSHLVFNTRPPKDYLDHPTHVAIIPLEEWEQQS